MTERSFWLQRCQLNRNPTWLQKILCASFSKRLLFNKYIFIRILVHMLKNRVKQNNEKVSMHGENTYINFPERYAPRDCTVKRATCIQNHIQELLHRWVMDYLVLNVVFSRRFLSVPGAVSVVRHFSCRAPSSEDEKNWEYFNDRKNSFILQIALEDWDNIYIRRMKNSYKDACFHSVIALETC